MEDTH